jgi:acetylornithine aminotransferase
MSALMSAYGRLPVTMARGEGATLWDTEGRRYLDALSGIAVCSLGHANSAIAAAIADQASTLLHVSNLYGIAEQESLGEELCRVSGMHKVFFCNSGAEANEAAIKIARRHGTGRGIVEPMIIVTDTAFHGRTLATISATGNEKLMDGFGQRTPGFLVVPYNDLEAIESMAASRNDIAAVLIEPVQGEGGINVPGDDYLPGLRAICDRQNWLLMCDEIQSGMGRTGRWFAHQHAGITPDVMSLAKSLGNGMPIGACLAHGAAAELIQPGSHGTTFGGNPIACRTALTVIREIEKNDYVTRAGYLGTRMLDRFRNALHNRAGINDIRGRGLMIGVELDRPCAELVAKALDAGILINVTAGSVVRLLPPYVLTDTEADDVVDRMAELIVSFLDKTQSNAADA